MLNPSSGSSAGASIGGIGGATASGGGTTAKDSAEGASTASAGGAIDTVSSTAGLSSAT